VRNSEEVAAVAMPRNTLFAQFVRKVAELNEARLLL
jgi:hypothetical protein